MPPTPVAERSAPEPTAQPAGPSRPTDELTAYIDGLPVVRSRSGKYAMRLTGLFQTRTGGGPVKIEVQARLTTDDPNVLLERDHVVRRLVVGDGTELSYPKYGRVLSHHRIVASPSMEVGHAQRELRDLVLDASIVEVLEWATVEVTAPAGRVVDTTLGPFVVRLTPEETGLTVGLGLAEDTMAAWDALLPQPRLRLVNHEWAADALEVTTADGSRLESGGGGGTGGSAAVQFASVAAAEAPGPIAYPVTVTLRIPRRYRIEHSLFRWQDLPLLPVIEH